MYLTYAGMRTVDSKALQGIVISHYRILTPGRWYVFLGRRPGHEPLPRSKWVHCLLNWNMAMAPSIGPLMWPCQEYIISRNGVSRWWLGSKIAVAEELQTTAWFRRPMNNTEDCEMTMTPHAFLLPIAWEFNENPYTRNTGLFWALCLFVCNDLFLLTKFFPITC